MKLFSSILALLTLTTSVSAGPALSPVGVTSSASSLANFPPSSLIDQSGLSTGFVSGVTDFDTYIASNPTHGTAQGTRWVATTAPRLTGPINLDFDFGSVLSIESLALWNVGNNNNANITQFNLLGDADGDFSSGSFSLLSSQAANPNTGPLAAVLPEVFSFAPSAQQFVRLEILSNNGSIFTGANEVAFEQSVAVVPEPSSLLFLITATLAGVGVLRKKNASGTEVTVCADES